MKNLTFQGYVGDEQFTPANVTEQLESAYGDEITVNLYTPGGLIYDGIEIYNRISAYPGKKTCILGGLVASIGTYISSAFDVVQAQDSTVFFMHNASSIIAGDSEDMRKESEELGRLNRHLAERLAAKSGKGVQEILTMMNEETYLYGKEIVDAGFADELIEVGADPMNEVEARKRMVAAEAKFSLRSNNIANKSSKKNTYEGESVLFYDELTAESVPYEEFLCRKNQRNNKRPDYWEDGKPRNFGDSSEVVKY